MSTALLLPEVAQPQVAAQIIAPHNQETNSQWPRKRLISAREYMKMAEIGLFDGQRVELIGGDIIDMPPMNEDHAVSLNEAHEQLGQSFFGQFKVRGQSPFNAGEHGRPEPDIAVVRPETIEKGKPPTQAVLLVEVSDSTLQYDRTTKASLYASLGVADYWIINLVENCVEVHRQPIEREAAQFGWDYASRTIYQRGQSVSLLEVPTVSIAVDDVLP